MNLICLLCGSPFKDLGNDRYACSQCPLEFDCSVGNGIFILEGKRFTREQMFRVLEKIDPQADTTEGTVGFKDISDFDSFYRPEHDEISEALHDFKWYEDRFYCHEDRREYLDKLAKLIDFLTNKHRKLKKMHKLKAFI